jgi:hypothetical protein
MSVAPSHERMIAGIAAAFVALGVAQLAGIPLGARADARAAVRSLVAELTPVPVKEWMLHTLGSPNKLFVGVAVLAGIATIAALVGALETQRRPFGSAAIAATGVLVCLAVLTRQGATALDTVPTIAGAACGMAALRMLTRRIRPGPRDQQDNAGHDEADPGRRTLVALGLLGFGVVSGVAGAAATRLVNASPSNAWANGAEPVAPGVNAMSSAGSHRIVAPSGDTTGATDLNAIKAAIGPGSVAVQLEAGTYYVNAPIVLQQNTHLAGAGMRATTIQLADNSNCNVVENLVSPDGNTGNAEYVAIRDMTIDGNKTHQTATSYGIYFATNPQYSAATNDECYDPHNEVSDVFIVNIRNDAVNTYGRGEHRFTNVVAYESWGNGFNIGSSDTFLIGCSAGNIGLAGFYLATSNAILTACKAFVCGTVTSASGIGFNVPKGNSITMSSCCAQDNKAHGFSLDGAQQVTLSACVADSNSVAGAGDYSGLYLNSASYCTVTGFVSIERKYNGTHSYQQNALQASGTCTHNNVTLTHSPRLSSSATVGPAVKPGSVSLAGNYVVVNGALLASNGGNT